MAKPPSCVVDNTKINWANTDPYITKHKQQQQQHPKQRRKNTNFKLELRV